jgi:HEAT repeat protein
MSSDDAATLGRGWTLLAAGRATEALNLAIGALTQDPDNLPMLSMAVEAEVTSSSSSAALRRYESWLGARTLDEPGVLRIIARAMLREFASEDQNPRGQVAALEALAESGDVAAADRLQSLSRSGSLAGTRALAEMGDPQAVNLLVLDLGGRSGNKVDAIEVLGRSGSPLALDVILAQIRDIEPAVRGAAADALGRLGSDTAVPHLLPMLGDQSAHVRVKAAGALLRLGETSGAGILDELAASDNPRTRLVAATALEGRPDPRWLGMVRELTAAGEPDIRLMAAKLLVPHDPTVAKPVLEALAINENPAVREDASQTLAAEVAGDLPSLRALLKTADRLTRIAAAGKILSLTR